MLKIQNNEFEIKYTEINIRQRMYQNESYITLMINTEFYPTLVENNIISGSVDIKLDIKNIRSLDELNDKKYKGDIGNVTLSVNNNGVWEHESSDKFEVKINKKEGKFLEFELKTKNCQLKTSGRLVSLYTTSTSNEELSKNFDLNDFHNNPIIKEIANSKIYKYYIK